MRFFMLNQTWQGIVVAGITPATCRQLCIMLFMATRSGWQREPINPLRKLIGPLLSNSNQVSHSTAVFRLTVGNGKPVIGRPTSPF